MQPKVKQLAAACALAFAGTAAQAAAPFDAPQVTVFLSGASAPQNFLGFMATQLFTGTQNTDWWAYWSNDGTVGANYRAYFGTLKSTVEDPNMPSSIAGKTALIINRAKGGSVWGVNPVARTQQIQWMDRSMTNCVTNASTNFNYTCSPTGDDSGSNGMVPDFGVSDVEPAMFKLGRNTEFDIALGTYADELSSSELASMTVKGVSALMFGQAVTLGVSGTVTDMSKDIFGGLLNGAYTSWNKVNPAFSSSDNVVVCRRVPGSGTQASYNQFYHNWPCSVNNITADGTLGEKRMADSAGYGVGGVGAEDGSSAANAIGIDASTGFTVIENSSSGNVRTCLVRAHTGAAFTLQDEGGLWHIVTFGGSKKAVGTLSLDSKGNTGYGTEWTFINVNGAAPDQANLINLKYPFHYELSMQYNTANYTALTADQKTLIDEFIKRSASPTVLAGISNANVRDSVAAVPTAAFPFGSHAKVMQGTRNANSCSPAVPK